MVLFKKDISAISLSYRAKKNIYSLNNKFLKKNAEFKNKIFRFCLNKNKKDHLHQMLIFQTDKYKDKIKKHPKKDKSYHLVKGKQLIKIYNKNGSIKKRVLLDKNNFFLWIGKNTYHNNITISKKSIHIETISGPFKRNSDRTYLKKK